MAHSAHSAHGAHGSAISLSYVKQVLLILYKKPEPALFAVRITRQHNMKILKLFYSLLL